MAAPRTVGALAVAMVVLAACRDDGRTLDPAPEVPVSRETTTTSGPGTDTAAAGDEAGGIMLTSPAFGEGGLLDQTYTCEGANVAPPLVISAVPPDTAELAIVVTDAGGFVHWAVAGIPPTVTSVEAGLLPPEAVIARSDGGIEGWDGPCPPPGGGQHAYDFTVHATIEPIGMAPGLAGRDAVALIEQATVASDTLVAFYASTSPG